MKLNKTNLAKMFILFAVLAGMGYASASIGRFTPTHAIVEPVYCGSCHPDQVVELNATTHLPHFAGAIYEEAEAINAGGSAEITQAEAVAGACMMCHNTWNNREKMFVNGYQISTENNQTRLQYNDIVTTNATTGTMYDVAVPNASKLPAFKRLGGNVISIIATVQDPGTSGLAAGTNLTDEVSVNSTGVTLQAGTNTSLLTEDTGKGAVKITYKVLNGSVVNLKTVWGDLSARSPTPGYFFNDQTGSASCGNPEKGFCHAIEISVGKNMMNQLPENTAGAGGKQQGSGNGIYFQHEMAYTSAEYAAKQVKLCGVCHVNKLPPMDADGNPIRLDLSTQKVIRDSHGTRILDTEITAISSDWAHKQVQCIRCHGHAGIGGEDAVTGVRSN